MSSSVGLLEFFILEASDYIARLDALLSSAGPSGPDSEAFVRQARALRGSATMARQSAVSDVAAAIERVGRSLRDGSLPWDAGLNGALIAAVEDLKTFLHGIRSWSAADDRRAQARAAELNRLVPASRRTPAPTPSGASSGFLLAEVADIATALERYVGAPEDRDALLGALRRVRALRGVAALQDVPPLPEVADAVERAAKSLERGAERASPEQLHLLGAAAAVFRRAATELGQGRRFDPASPEMHRFAAAEAALAEQAGEHQRIVPVTELFFDDPGPHVVVVAPHPPTTLAQRFRMEVVSQAEHLRRLVADARGALGPASRDPLVRDLRASLLGLGTAAESFGERDVARLLASWSDRLASVDGAALSGLEEVAALLADPTTPIADLTAVLERPRSAATDSQPSPAAERKGSTPTGRELQALLEDGIAGISLLETTPLSQPVPIIDEHLIPIQELLYRGRRALDRANEVRDQIRRHGRAPAPEEVEEILDLLELAAAD